MSAIRFRTAFVPHDLEAPIKGASAGPLAGLTAAIKDMYDIKGTKSGGGNPDWLKHAKPATSNASLIQKLPDAGATIVGKTISEEFFFSLTGANVHYGIPVNPRAPGRVPGGSSSGSAAAAASNACDFAIGSDTGGSVRIPASFCGLYGLRPTHARVDMTGAMDMAHSFDVGGWFANAPGIFRRVGDVLLGGERVDAAIANMIVLDDAFAEADPAISELVKAALGAMAGELPKPHHDKIAPEGLDVWREGFRVLQAREVWQAYGDFVTKHEPVFGPGVKERFHFASIVTDDEVAKANDVRRRLRERVASMVRPGTILALPTSPAIAPLVTSTAEQLEAFRARALRLTCTSSMSGVPQVTIPIGTVSGCPAGLSFIGWRGGDEALLALAGKLSRYCGLEG
ncbi:MAG TPA: amidase [Pseudorhodoplanes sp.]|nr:amidase [Pseudorhodoplanes sp.]